MALPEKHGPTRPRLLATVGACLLALASISIATAAEQPRRPATAGAHQHRGAARTSARHVSRNRKPRRFVMGLSKGRAVAIRQRQELESLAQSAVEQGHAPTPPGAPERPPGKPKKEDEPNEGEEPGETPGTVIYVSPTGSDDNPGTQEAPLKSLDILLPRLTSGETVLLEPGSYTLPTKDTTVRSATVHVVGNGPTPSSVELLGYRSWGATNISFEHVRFTAPILLTDDPLHRGYTAASASIAIASSEITAPGQSCLSIFNGSHDIEVRDIRIFNCKNGIVGGSYYSGPEFESRRISIRDSVITSLTGDGIHFGYWNSVLIEGNEVGNLADPELLIHNDALQLTGPDTEIRIARNHLHDSQGQLLFMRTNFGAIDDILIENNLIHGSGAVAAQSLAVTQARFVNNTIWDSELGGLILRGSPASDLYPGYPAATDTVLANNILFYLALSEGAEAAVLTNNLIRTSGVVPAGNISIAMTDDPGFTDASAGDYSLLPESPAVGAAAPELAPAIDLYGMVRSESSPSIGAIEYQSPGP